VVEVVTVEVTDAEADKRVDHVLVGRLGDRTRSQIQRLIKEGRAQVGAKTARASTVVRVGDVVTLEIPAPVPAQPRAEDLHVDILYDDVDLVVVSKPAGMVVHPAAGHTDGTLVNALLHHVRDLSGVGGELRPGIVHRLDRGTSGVMVVAKHDRAHAELARQFKEREVEKRYAVLVWGVVQAGRRIDLPVGRDPVHRKKISTRSRRGRAALTRITRAEDLQGVSFLEVAIATGRTHQIRVHLSAIGHPVVGDALYGGTHRHPTPSLRAVQRLERPFLHAAHLAFHHPADGRVVEFQSPLPEDLVSVLSELRAEARKDEAPTD
jgi:23S rRNA pseudouridine1911/1915/1917 synthase